MRVLILGGNGFLGSHLVDALLARGDTVDVVGRAPTLFNPDLIQPPHALVKYYQVNFVDTNALKPLLEQADVIYHLVSTMIPATSNQYPVVDIQENLISTVKILEILRYLPPKRFIYFSSGGTVYGTPQHIPIAENHPLDPKSSYGIVKVAIEKYLHMYGELYGVSSVVLRLANPYGPRQMKIGVQGVVATVLMSILQDKPITIWGDGKVIRDYIYIEDVVRLLLLVTDSQAVGTFNVGSGVGHSLLDILATAQQITEKTPQVNYLPSRNFDIPAVVLDVAHVSETFDWRPEISLTQGMSKHWQWLQQIEQR
ncbi:NAD-dependent epimerase/dehydratase family protein [Aquirhabdus parva]|uniref:NAD-dependent epimerase/dehydratase family protein n=1 Tax=Aquirhabdus parva TaxID=2283318 RepID=A0A345P740_9GAMM|nr:NAD-dependent epimerase/dehydratase family protein [Aquirhabdus parva]AXI03099.1 NAD-dependent epimerase/dehydratase family protein [Aquirhabdus parva]